MFIAPDKARSLDGAVHGRSLLEIIVPYRHRRCIDELLLFV